MRHKLKKIAFLLIITFLATMIPTNTVLAQEPGIPDDIQTSAESPPSVVGEVTSKRTENTKYFLMSDG